MFCGVLHKLSGKPLFAIAVAVLVPISACSGASENDEDGDGTEDDSAADGASTGTGGDGTALEPSYLKASNSDAGDLFGVSIALATDGYTMAIGANREGSAATGVNGDEADNATADAGAVYIFSHSGSTWQQDAYLKAANSGPGDAFGSSLAISADGNTVAVGAPYESSVDDSVSESGAVYLFVRSGSAWEQQALVKASNPHEDAYFGMAVSLSADGNLLVVGAEGEDSGAAGIDGDQGDRSADESGAAYVFRRSGNAWSQEAYLKASNPDAYDHFGGAVALSGDGSALSVGADFEDGAGTGANGDPNSNTTQSSGAVYLFEQSASGWQQQAYLKPTENDGYGLDAFGSSVSLSEDGGILAVGAPGDASSASGVDGEQNDSSMPYAGAVYVFVRKGDLWEPQAYVKASNTGAGDEFGYHLHLAANGQSLVVGAALEGGSVGSAYVYVSDGEIWQQRELVSATNPDAGDRFGWSLALSGDGAVLAVGAAREGSATSGVDGDQNDNSAARSGATYVYYR